jgi:hypothetical protein
MDCIAEKAASRMQLLILIPFIMQEDALIGISGCIWTRQKTREVEDERLLMNVRGQTIVDIGI